MSENNNLSETSQESIAPAVSVPEQPASRSVHPSSSNNYAGFWIRFLAYCVDIIVIYLLMFVVGSVLAVVFLLLIKVSPAVSAIGLILSYIFIFCLLVVYFIGFWAKSGQTPGMKLLALKVQKEDGQPLGFRAAIIRYIGLIISFAVFYLGVIWVGVDDKKQGWHDKIASTFVVHTGAKSHKGIALLIAIVPFILLFFLIPLLTFFLIAFNPAAKFNQSNVQTTNVVAVMTQDQADDFAHTTFAEINNLRKTKNVPQLKEDLLLCSYAQRRLEQLTALGRLDDEKGINEDWANPQMQAAYFNNYAELKENSFKLDKYASIDSILHFWGKDKNDPNYGIVYSKYTQGCIRATPQFIYFIDGQLK